MLLPSDHHQVINQSFVESWDSIGAATVPRFDAFYAGPRYRIVVKSQVHQRLGDEDACRCARMIELIYWPQTGWFVLDQGLAGWYGGPLTF
jgi:hypothetical protein